ncbi:MAG TPA: DEDD exonuclease domain-containing protein [Acidimicrobiales bacterium]
MQRSFDELGTPLHEVTFCVLDLETTGGSPRNDTITEVGAVKVRGGECLGTFQTLVNPGVPIPPMITVLAGITEAMVLPAPRIEEVLPALAEFVGGSVLVGHNVRFDWSFLDASLVAHDWPRLGLRRVDTAGLARRLVRDEVPDCQLGTLARHFRLSHQPSHRALEDALATVDLLHLLLERAAAFGVTALDDLLVLPRLARHPQAAKLRLTDRLSRGPGVYIFRDGQGRALYVGMATDLRSRVRSYFGSDDRRKIGPMLREAQAIDHLPCSSSLEAGVVEARLIHELAPRYNRRGKTWRTYRYVKLTRKRFPRLAVVQAPRADGAHYLGPVSSTQTARLVVEAIESVVPLRRCPASPARVGTRDGPCAPAQLGVATCPCSGQIDESDYGALVDRVKTGWGDRPQDLLEPLAVRMQTLAEAERFEDATSVRERARALAGALRRQRRFDALRHAGRMLLDLPGGGGAELARGRLVRVWGMSPEGRPGEPVVPHTGQLRLDLVELPPEEGPLPRGLADELNYVGTWLDRYAARVNLVHVDGAFTSPLPALPTFAPENVRPRS